MAAVLAREREGGENGRVHCVRGVAVEVMRVLGADERGQGRRTGAKCRRCSVTGRPRRRARLRFRHGDGHLIERLRQRLSPKPNELGDGVVDKVGVLAEFYNIVN